MRRYVCFGFVALTFLLSHCGDDFGSNGQQPVNTGGGKVGGAGGQIVGGTGGVTGSSGGSSVGGQGGAAGHGGFAGHGGSGNSGGQAPGGNGGTGGAAGHGGDAGHGGAGGQSPGTHLWSKSFGDAALQYGRPLNVDPSGNVIVGGFFQGSVDFGSGTPLTSAGDYDLFIAKYDPNGNHLWSKRYGDSAEQKALGIVATSTRVFMTGRFKGAVDFGGNNLQSAGDNDVFLVALDNNGNHIWSYRYGDADYEEAYGIALDSNGNLVIVGHFGSGIDFGGSTLTSNGIYDVFVAKFDSDGNHIWSNSFGDASNQNALSVAVDPSDNILVTGNFQGSINFGGGTLPSAGNRDIYVAKLNSSGGHVWSDRFGEADDQFGTSVAVDASSNVAITGYFENAVNFGGTSLTSYDSEDIFIAVFDGAGNHSWSKRLGYTGADRGRWVTFDPSGSIVLSASFVTLIDFGGGTAFSSAGSHDILIAKFDAVGGLSWAQAFGGTGIDVPYGIVTDAAGNIITTGYFGATIGFGGNPLVSLGDPDIFLAKFGP